MNSHAICVRLVILVTVILAATTKSSTAIMQPKPDCPTTCGNLTDITFPFGTSPDCYLDETFFINCNHTSFQPPQPFLRHGNLTVLNISLENGEMGILFPTSRICFNSSGGVDYANSITWEITIANFPFSYTRNKFFGVGCATTALIRGPNFTTGCISDCVSAENVVSGSCAGIGCCESQIPRGVNEFKTAFGNFGNHTEVLSFNPCSYFFVAEEGSYSFESSDLWDLQGRDEFPAVLDWAVGNVTCNEAKQNKSSYACRSSNSYCIDSTNGPGYRCNCSSGYRGNPYLNNGCQDIDECGQENDCEKKCVNIPGNYTCTCPKGYHGDGRKSGKGCTAGQFLVIKVVLGTIISVTVLLVCFYLIYFGHRKRKLIMLKEKFFQQNGGFLLQQQLSRRERANETATIFSAEELERATDNYADNRIIGKGGYGTVYKGILADNRTVAIKKSKVVDQTQIEQFINEVVVLSQINHRNVVKLLGCCLETQVPLLVYEYIANGTLFDHIHDESKASSMTFEVRLRIAAETAGVLSYLHSSASTPIIHRDVKPTNILLDDNYVAKVSDFGASRLVPLDQDELSTIVQGTLGYLDPEYMHTSQLTEKSDVYSFGVVLVELLTGKKALCFNRPEGDRNLAIYFLSALKDNRLFNVVEDHIKHEQGNTDQLMEVAKLAKRCLRVKGDERPTMKEVAMELEGLRVVEKHPWVNSANLISEETEYLLSESSFKNHDEHDNRGGSSSVTAAYDSIAKQVAFSIDDGR